MSGFHTLPRKVRDRIQAVFKIEEQIHEQRMALANESAILEDNYNKKYAELFKKRSEIVNGLIEIEESAVEKDTVEGGAVVVEEGAAKGIPDFWLLALQYSFFVKEEITGDDADALRYLKDIKWCNTTEHRGFKLEFFFGPNPFFKNRILTRTYETNSSLHFIKTTGTEIEWTPCESSILISEVERCKSFFNFFKLPTLLEGDELGDQFYKQGKYMKNSFIPRAVIFYKKSLSGKPPWYALSDKLTWFDKQSPSGKPPSGNSRIGKIRKSALLGEGSFKHAENEGKMEKKELQGEGSSEPAKKKGKKKKGSLGESSEHAEKGGKKEKKELHGEGSSEPAKKRRKKEKKGSLGDGIISENGKKEGKKERKELHGEGSSEPTKKKRKKEKKELHDERSSEPAKMKVKKEKKGPVGERKSSEHIEKEEKKEKKQLHGEGSSEAAKKKAKKEKKGQHDERSSEPAKKNVKKEKKGSVGERRSSVHAEKLGKKGEERPTW